MPHRPARGNIRDVFLRLLGATFVVAFVSLAVQLDVLFGARGLLPACRVAPLAFPTIFRVACNDALLLGTAITGALLGGALALLLAPRWTLLACWALYLSFAAVGQDFLSFQWDNLLLEAGFFAFFVTPRGWRPRHAPSPHPAGVFLMQWLLFRLHVESGAAKLLLGDPTWWNLTAMIAYYETAPLPTWVGWWAHQLPAWAQRASAAFTFVVELAAPLCIWGPRRLRAAVFLVMAAMQVSVILTANYGFFNYLSLALCLWVLDDEQLGWVAARFGRRVAPAPPGGANPVLVAVAVVLVPLSVIPFLRFVPPLRPVAVALDPVRDALATIRSMNAYHLFAQMTLVRREAVIEGSDDGVTWRPYEFRWKPGDPSRAPAFVAPHQPRVDFQMWFLLLGRHSPPWFDALLQRILSDPAAVTSLWADDPFARRAPAQVRVALYRYVFTDRATRRETGRWWDRTLEGTTRPLSRPP